MKCWNVNAMGTNSELRGILGDKFHHKNILLNFELIKIVNSISRGIVIRTLLIHTAITLLFIFLSFLSLLTFILAFVPIILYVDHMMGREYALLKKMVNNYINSKNVLECINYHEIVELNNRILSVECSTEVCLEFQKLLRLKENKGNGVNFDCEIHFKYVPKRMYNKLVKKLKNEYMLEEFIIKNNLK